MKNFKSLVIFVSLLFFFSCNSPYFSKKQAYKKEFINGFAFVAPPKPFDSLAFFKIKQTNANWIAVIPYGFHKYNNPNIKFNADWQWWGETKVGVKQTITDAKKNGLRVILKPSIYIPGGNFTGHMKWDSEEEWIVWEESYKKFILEFAAIAESNNVDLFSIGTENKAAVVARPNFWLDLIAAVRKVYSGKLTYASNWDEFEIVPFWNELDYIGVNAYFKLSNKKSPTKETLIKAWETHLPKFSAIAKKYEKPILFTEYGYLSVDNCAWKTWEIEKNVGSRNINEDCQANAIEALQTVFKNEPYWAGGILWKWFPNGMGHEGHFKKDYTPQNKKAEKIITEIFKE